MSLRRPEPRVITHRRRGVLQRESYRSRGHHILDRLANEAVRDGFRISGVHVVVMYTPAGKEVRAGFKADGAWDSWPEAAGCLAAAQGLLHEAWRDG